MTDPEGKRLLDAWVAVSANYSSAMRELNARLGTVSHDEYERLRELSEQSRIACLVADHAFEEYFVSKN